MRHKTKNTQSAAADIVIVSGTHDRANIGRIAAPRHVFSDYTVQSTRTRREVVINSASVVRRRDSKQLRFSADGSRTAAYVECGHKRQDQRLDGQRIGINVGLTFGTYSGECISTAQARSVHSDSDTIPALSAVHATWLLLLPDGAMPMLAAVICSGVASANSRKMQCLI